MNVTSQKLFIAICIVTVLFGVQGCKRSKQVYSYDQTLFRQQTIDELRTEKVQASSLQTEGKSSARLVKPSKGSVEEQEARLVDIPIPLGSKAIGHVVESNTQQRALHYTNRLSCQQLSAWYLDEMERSGWQQVAFIDEDQRALLMFEKPQRFCTIIVQTQEHKKGKDKNSIHLSLYTGIKKQALS